jgi:sugar phosphate isomerase/epimerase
MIDFSRRHFLQTSSAALAAAALPRWPFGSPREDIDRVGLQLYTVRNEMQRDMDATLTRVAQIGYMEVEFAGYFNRAPAQVKSLLDRLDLSAPSAHMPYESLDNGWAKVLDDANAIGHRYVVIAWTPVEVRKTIDDWKRIAEKFNRAAEASEKQDLRFAYHNHNFEFVPIEGQIPYDVLTAATDPDDVKLEMDLYWITSAGGDPFKYFARYPDRFPMVHVKDWKKGGHPEMVDVGAGDIDFKKIFAQHGRAGIKHYFVEHDEPADPFASITASYRYLRALRF